jgi:TPP-dependent trihydroxycyclohexane-1,2-dione (THcHDO) dehydratase
MRQPAFLEDLQAGRTSPKEEAVSDAIATIQKFRNRVRPKIVAGWGVKTGLAFSAGKW